MIQEDENLLLKDICGRLPYGVKCYAYQYKIDGNHCECYGTLEGISNGYFYLLDRVSINGGKIYDEHYLEVKPYLRPMSSMTDEERAKIAVLSKFNGLTKSVDFAECSSIVVDYCNSRHLDYRGLIPMGLALEAPEDMYE